MAPQDGSTSPALLDSAKAANAQAWREIVRRYSALIYNECRVEGLPPQEAADVTQDVFHSLLTLLMRFEDRSRTGGFRRWLRSVTRHKVQEHRRRAGRQPTGEGGTVAYQRMMNVAAEAVVDSEAPNAKISSRLRQVMSSVERDFDDRTWRAFWRATVDAQPGPEVADELGMSPHAVRKAKSRVLARIREEFQWMGVDAYEDAIQSTLKALSKPEAE